MSYQAVVRNGSGQLLINQGIAVKVSLLQGSPAGTLVYSERLTGNTNANGLISMEIGTGTVLSGVFSSIDWTLGNYYLKQKLILQGNKLYNSGNQPVIKCSICYVC